jgi:hypothetical protein
LAVLKVGNDCDLDNPVIQALVGVTSAQEKRIAAVDA